MPQTYGTQTKPKNSQLHFHTLKNVKHIDTLRKKMRLGTLREYSQTFKTRVLLPEGYKENGLAEISYYVLADTQ